MAHDNNLPPELQCLLDELAGGSEQIHPLWSYALLLLLFYDEKARIVQIRFGRETLELEFETLGGQRFHVVRWEMSHAAEYELLNAIRESLGMHKGVCQIKLPERQYPT